MAGLTFIEDAESQIYQDLKWFEERPRILDLKDLTMETAESSASDQYRLIDLVGTLAYHTAGVEDFKLLLDRKVAKDHVLVSKLNRAGCYIRMRRRGDQLHVRMFSGQNAEAATMLEDPLMSTRLKSDLWVRYVNGPDGVWTATAADIGNWYGSGSRSGVIEDVLKVFVRIFLITLAWRQKQGDDGDKEPPSV